MEAATRTIPEALGRFLPREEAAKNSDAASELLQLLENPFSGQVVSSSRIPGGGLV